MPTSGGWKSSYSSGLCRPRKKRTVGALERDEWRRAAWKVTVSGALDARSLVFVDEMGTNTSLSPLYGWSKKGQRAYGSEPRNLKARTPRCLPA
jgi:hypothetical protein